MIQLFLYEEGADVPCGPEWITPLELHCHNRNLPQLHYVIAEALDITGFAALAVAGSPSFAADILNVLHRHGGDIELIAVSPMATTRDALEHRNTTLADTFPEHYLGIVPEPFFHHAMRLVTLNAADGIPGSGTDLALLTALLLENNRDLFHTRCNAWDAFLAAHPIAAPPSSRIEEQAGRPIPTLPAAGRPLVDIESETLPFTARLCGPLSDMEHRVRRVCEEGAGALLRLRHKLSMRKNDPATRAIRDSLTDYSRGSDTAIIAHLHYPDLIPEFVHTLKQHDADIFISLSALAGEKDVAHIRQELPRAVLFRFPNVGRDVYPFLEIFRRYGCEYKYICKIHGKKSLWKGDRAPGEKWRQSMVEGLLGSPERVKAVISAFKADPLLGIIAPEGYFAPLPRYWLANKHNILWLARLHDTPFDASAGFVPGTMFWARTRALVPLLRGPRYLSFKEDGGIDGARAHGYERFFCMAASGFGFHSTTMDKAAFHPNPRD